MNDYDTQVAEGLLQAAGFEIVHEYEAENEGSFKSSISAADPSPHKKKKPTLFSQFSGGSPQEAEAVPDIVLMNTCSVREHAEIRVYGRLGLLGKAKKENPNLIVGLMGCMVEEHKEKLFKRFPQLDLMVGTRNIKELPALINEVRNQRRQVSKIKQDGISIEYTDQIKRDSLHHAWLPIMTGCNKVCTYCIVPITRGAEVSMPAREVYREASRLVSEGVKCITLLGQNVNSYDGIAESSLSLLQELAVKQPGQSSPSSEIASSRYGGTRNDEVRFPELLEMLCEIEGLERISFTTSHPQDATEELFQVIARSQKISRRFHLPLQSGSDRMLKRMARLHQYADYKKKIVRLRELVPDIAVTTDIIAGFSGETEEDHQVTLNALRELRYDGAYIYKYSIRAQTPAAKLPDDVPLEVKERRNQELLGVQKLISEESNRAWLGKTVQVFVEGVSAKNKTNLIGRTSQDKQVVFEGAANLIGTFQDVELVSLFHNTFQGHRKFLT